jgi:hypothetical protein
MRVINSRIALKSQFQQRHDLPRRSIFAPKTTGSGAIGPARSGCSRSTAMSARQSPPSATAAARSATIFSGSCTARGGRHRASPPDSPRPSPVTRIAPTAGPSRLGHQAPGPGRQRTRRHRRYVRYSSRQKCLGSERTGRWTSPILRGQGIFISQRASGNSRRKLQAGSSRGRCYPGTSGEVAQHRGGSHEWITDVVEHKDRVRWGGRDLRYQYV